MWKRTDEEYVSRTIDCDGFEIKVDYTGEGNAGKGITLDHTIIPKIIRAANKEEELVQYIEDRLDWLEMKHREQVVKNGEWEFRAILKARINELLLLKKEILL